MKGLKGLKGLFSVLMYFIQEYPKFRKAEIRRLAIRGIDLESLKLSDAFVILGKRVRRRFLQVHGAMVGLVWQRFERKEIK